MNNPHISLVLASNAGAAAAAVAAALFLLLGLDAAVATPAVPLVSLLPVQLQLLLGFCWGRKARSRKKTQEHNHLYLLGFSSWTTWGFFFLEMM